MCAAPFEAVTNQNNTTFDAARYFAGQPAQPTKWNWMAPARAEGMATTFSVIL
jgi:hypothetical protein